MIIKLILQPFWVLIDMLISILPVTPLGTVGSLTTVLEVACYGVKLIGLAEFIKVIGVIASWHTIHLGWSIVEWLYNKIPGVN